jgi:hypothetical protein
MAHPRCMNFKKVHDSLIKEIKILKEINLKIAKILTWLLELSCNEK